MGWGRFWHTTAPGRRQLVARVPSRRALSARPFPFLACDRDLGLWANQGCDPSVVPRLLPRNCAARDGTLRSGRSGIPKGRRFVSPDGSCFGRRAVFSSRKIGEDYSVLRVRLRIGRRSPSVRITLPKPSFPANARPAEDRHFPIFLPQRERARMRQRDSFSDCFPASNESSTGGWVASSARSKHLSASDTNAHVLPVIHHSSPAPTIITDPGRREPKPDDMTGLATYRNSIIPKVLSGVRGSSMSPMEPFKPSVNGATKCSGALPEYKWRWLRCAAERRKSSPKPWSPPASPSIRSSN